MYIFFNSKIYSSCSCYQLFPLSKRMPPWFDQPYGVTQTKLCGDGIGTVVCLILDVVPLIYQKIETLKSRLENSPTVFLIGLPRARYLVKALYQMSKCNLTQIAASTEQKIFLKSIPEMHLEQLTLSVRVVPWVDIHLDVVVF